MGGKKMNGVELTAPLFVHEFEQIAVIDLLSTVSSRLYY